MQDLGEVDKEVLELSLLALSKQFDEFVAACVDPEGQPKQPSFGAAMKARGCLPPYCDMSFNKGAKSVRRSNKNGSTSTSNDKCALGGDNG